MDKLSIIFPVIFLVVSCSSGTNPLNYKDEDDTAIKFLYELQSVSRSASGEFYRNVKIENTSFQTITYWILTVRVQTDFPRSFIGSLYDTDINLGPQNTYLAKNTPLALRPSCVNTDTVCCISISASESITAWEVIGTYAEGF